MAIIYHISNEKEGFHTIYHDGKKLGKVTSKWIEAAKRSDHLIIKKG